ncbi:MAG: hypothetical protein EOO38_19205 [Cytophagaceae bacterium]|nr:MAG: hypothetical protein EOO38_19205 [Cytophagaceae bacterium]
MKIFIDKISLLGPDHLIVVAGALPVSPYGFDGLAVPCRASRICPHFGWATWRVRPGIREFPSPSESVAAFETRLRIVVWRFEGVPGWVGLCGLLTGWPPHTGAGKEGGSARAVAVQSLATPLLSQPASMEVAGGGALPVAVDRNDMLSPGRITSPTRKYRLSSFALVAIILFRSCLAPSLSLVFIRAKARFK